VVSDYVKTLAGMIMNRTEYRLAVDAEKQQGKLSNAISELAAALRGDEQKQPDNHYPNINNEG